MMNVQRPAECAAPRFGSTFRSSLASAVLVLAGCSARPAAALPEAFSGGGAQTQAQEARSDGGTDKRADKTKTTGAGARADSASENGKSSAESEKPAGGADDDSKTTLSSVETTEEQRERLGRELDSSLREFDGLILKEQQLLEEKRDAEAAAAGTGTGVGSEAEGEGGSGEGGEGESGGGGADAGTGAKGSKDGGGATAETSAGGTGGSPDLPAGEPVEGGEAGGGGDRGQISNGRVPVPPDVGDGHDDDIVARQLREAAMKEEDPALREKLWEEYRAYKFGTPKGTGDGSKKDEKKDNPR